MKHGKGFQVDLFVVLWLFKGTWGYHKINHTCLNCQLSHGESVTFNVYDPANEMWPAFWLGNCCGVSALPTLLPLLLFKHCCGIIAKSTSCWLKTPSAHCSQNHSNWLSVLPQVVGCRGSEPFRGWGDLTGGVGYCLFVSALQLCSLHSCTYWWSNL